MPDDASQSKAPDVSADLDGAAAAAASQTVAELAGIWSGTMMPTQFVVGANPDAGLVKIVFTVRDGVELEVLLRAGDHLDKMFDDLRAANLRAKSGLIVAKGGSMKGIAGA